MIWLVNGCSGSRKREIGSFRKVEKERNGRREELKEE